MSADNYNSTTNPFTKEYVEFNYIMIAVVFSVLIIIIIIAKLLCIYGKRRGMCDEHFPVVDESLTPKVHINSSSLRNVKVPVSVPNWGPLNNAAKKQWMY
ncbi:hypothetical protein CHUAL_001102 [Chamberlinius hualienensis]